MPLCSQVRLKRSRMSEDQRSQLHFLSRSVVHLYCLQIVVLWLWTMMWLWNGQGFLLEKWQALSVKKYSVSTFTRTQRLTTSIEYWARPASGRKEWHSLIWRQTLKNGYLPQISSSRQIGSMGLTCLFPILKLTLYSLGRLGGEFFQTDQELHLQKK